jgi:hypothetical protein
MPYANGPLLLGHLAGAHLPADIFARWSRMLIGAAPLWRHQPSVSRAKCFPGTISGQGGPVSALCAISLRPKVQVVDFDFSAIPAGCTTKIPERTG